MAPKAATNPLASLRVAQDLTTQQVADRIGVSRQAVNYWENGVNTPTLTNLLAYAKACGVDAQTVIEAWEQTDRHAA